MVVVLTYTLGEKLEQRLNYGTVFRDEGKMFFSNDNWKHTFALELHYPDFSTPEIPSCDCPDLKQAWQDLAHLQNETFDYVNKSLNHINTILPNLDITPRSSRNRRSLLPFIGTISKGLFGLATTNDVQNVAKHVNALIRRSQALSTGFVNNNALLTSFINHTDNRLSNLFSAVKENHGFLTKLALDMKTTTKIYRTQQTLILKTLTKILSDNGHIQKAYSDLSEGSNMLLQGKLPEQIVPYNVLQECIRNISFNVNKKGYSLFSSDPSFYYANAKTNVFRHGTTIFISMDFPLVNNDFMINLYKIFSYPVPINNTSPHVSKVTNLPDFVAVTHDGKFYTEINTVSLSTCKKYHTKTLCSFMLPLHHVSNPSCSLSLLKANKTDINKLCDFRFLPNKMKPAVLQLNLTHYLVYNTTQLNLLCAGSLTKSLTGCHFCLITVPCNCSINTTSVFIPHRFLNCHHHSKPITMLHPINLALLQQYFDTKVLDSIQAHTTYPEPLNISVPDFKIFEHQYSKIVATEQYEHLSLKKMALQAKQYKTVFTSLADPLLESSIKSDNSFSWVTVLAASSTALTVICTIAVTFLFRKYRRINQLLLTSQLIAQAKAMPIDLPSFIYTTLAPVTTTNSPTFDIDSIPPSNVLTLVLCITVILLYKVVRYFCRSIQTSTLILEVTNGYSSIQFPCLKLPKCIQHLNFEGADFVKNLTISNGKFPKLTIDFGDFSIYNRITKQHVPLITLHRLNPLQGYRLRSITNKPFHIALWVKHNQTCTPIYPIHHQHTKSTLYPNLSSETPLLQHS